MSHRLQVLIPDSLDVAISAAAARRRISKGEFVRSALEQALAQQVADADPVARLAALNAPTADVAEMLEDVESRYA
jgi:hypothetical protein